MMTEEGPGLPVLPAQGHGAEKPLLDYWRQYHESALWLWRRSPRLSSSTRSSGTTSHWDHYKDNMYTTVIDGEDYAIKPMNCPGGMLVYRRAPFLPQAAPALAGAGPGHRHEMSGALHGYVRCFRRTTPTFS